MPVFSRRAEHRVKRAAGPSQVGRFDHRRLGPYRRREVPSWRRAQPTPRSPMFVRPINDSFGAEAPVAVPPAERPLSDLSGDLRRNRRLWASCAETGPPCDRVQGSAPEPIGWRYRHAIAVGDRKQRRTSSVRVATDCRHTFHLCARQHFSIELGSAVPIANAFAAPRLTSEIAANSRTAVRRHLRRCSRAKAVTV